MRTRPGQQDGDGSRSDAISRGLAVAALFGAAFALACDIGMWLVIDGYDPVAQTISELAAGPHKWVQDYGIVVFALGTLGLALAHLLHGGSGVAAWTVRVALVLLVLDVGLVAVWNQYGNGRPGGLVIHTRLVWALYAIVPILMWSAASAPIGRDAAPTRFGRKAAVAWVVLAPVYYVVPPGLDGAYERLLAIAMIGTVAGIAWRLQHDTRDAVRDARSDGPAGALPRSAGVTS